MKRLLIFCLFLTSCCSTPPPSPSRLHLSFNTFPTTSDPRRSGDFVSSTLICLIYEGLARCVPNGDIELALAEKVEISPDQKTYTFFLRESFWSDGVPVTAFDFETSWKTILDPAFPSICAYLLYPIKNGEKCAKGELPLSEVAIHAIDERTLLVELERPTPHFLSLTAFPLLLPFPSHIQSQDLPITNGPFQVKKMSPNSEILLSKNPTFWNPEQVFLDQIQIAIVPDESTAYQMFERGDLDWLGGPFAPVPPDVLETGCPNLQFIPMAASTFCTFNTKEGPFVNENIRKAFSYAIDRSTIVREVTQAGQFPADRCIPPFLSGISEPLYPLHNPDEAIRLFKKGLEEIDARELDSLVLYFRPGQMDKRLAQALQKQWKDTLGVTIALQQIDPKAHLQKLQKRDYQIAIASWIAQFHDPINLLERFKDPSNPKNYSAWENRRFAQLIEASQETLDPQKRKEFLQDAEALLAQETPIAPIYHWSNPSLAGNRILEIPVNSTGAVLFERIKVKKK